MPKSAESVSDENPAPQAGDFFLADLLPALRRLDALIQQAVIAAEAAYGSGSFADFYRGLHIPLLEVEQLLAREPGAPILYQEAGEGDSPWSEVLPIINSRFTWLSRAFGLSSFDLDIILIALAPEIDLRYERLYAYLQNNVSRRRPSVDLVLNLLCPTAQAKLARRAHFGSRAPLLHHGLVHLIPDSDYLQPPLLAQYLKLDDQIASLLLGQASLDARLAPFCRLTKPILTWEQLFLDHSIQQGLRNLGYRFQQTGRPLRLYFKGLPGSGRGRAAQALAKELDLHLLTVDLPFALEVNRDWTTAFRLLFREARFHGAILYLDGLDSLQERDQSLTYQTLLAELADAGMDRTLHLSRTARTWPGAPCFAPLTEGYHID